MISLQPGRVTLHRRVQNGLESGSERISPVQPNIPRNTAYIATPGSYLGVRNQLIDSGAGQALDFPSCLYDGHLYLSADISEVNSHMKSLGCNFDGESEILLLL